MTSPQRRARFAGTLARTLAVATAVGTAAVATAIPDQASGVSPAFGITGSIGGLYPGASLSLKLTATNHESFRITVTSISTTVHDASASCPAHYLTVGDYTGSLVVPVSGAGSVHVPVHLSHAAGNACQGVTFPLTYVGRAKKA